MPFKSEVKQRESNRKSYRKYRAKRIAHNSANRRLLNSAYGSWVNMRQRCNNPANTDYPRWGGRGIKVCESWNDFEVFLKDVGHRPSAKYSLERIDNDGNYEPGNVRWATALEQGQNTRRTKLITYGNETHSLRAWGRILDCHHQKVEIVLSEKWG